MSGQRRFTKKVTEFPIAGDRKRRWSNEDKERLLAALKKYGYKDIDKIAKELPNKTTGAIRTMINKLNREAKEVIETRDSHIHHWLSSGTFEGPDTLLSQALKFIALFEQIPQPEECAGCDFRALYRALSHATMGYPPTDISKMTHETLCYVMSQAVHEIWPFYQKELIDHVSNLEQEKTRKTYGRANSIMTTSLKQENEIKRERAG